MQNCSVGQSECEMKFSSQEIRYGLRKMHGFHGNRLYDSRDWGDRPTNSIISRVLLILEH